MSAGFLVQGKAEAPSRIYRYCLGADNAAMRQKDKLILGGGL
jgi:hypothetical protein